ncbi:RNA-guided endonuclease InsQ/TnpB family protein [Alicyclobacillus acidocaldarius]|uniref:Transposase, IS605 OrfB family n=1 Tax=Alicyclobacillus acidocaldarius (strain Tc-4-1) TaxID=1048834 RepID=F8IHQ2_ALIAT|nr:RNA-guided endonuclease TnpB family protein [Alicyclobacillus acidocaldarius]AEJ42019.1 transposase, IS605 OrfB family [Alicyclobacillus acidocaldarius subsp. acidocaldarius Tc-4-1]
MKIHRAYRYELAPNRMQRSLLAKHAGAARFAYNWGLARRIALYEETGQSTNAIEQHRELNRLKKTDFPWMYEVSKCAPQEALRDLDRAFQHFFRGLKEGRRVGFPRFKKKGRDDSFRLTGSIRVLDNAIQLPRLGRIRLKEKPHVEGRILSATVKREADRWYVSLSAETEIPDPVPPSGEPVDVDLGVSWFLTLSDGTKIEAPKPLARYLRRLRRLSKRHSRKKPGSRNRRKSALALARLHRKIRNIRQDFLHKVTTELAKTKRVIVIEDLHVRGMVQNRTLARAISDVGFGEFRRMLTYKCTWYGSELIVAPRFYASSKTCSACGYVISELPLSVREWTCPACSTRHDRDINAAKNLLRIGTASSAGSDACGDPSGGAALGC